MIIPIQNNLQETKLHTYCTDNASVLPGVGRMQVITKMNNTQYGYNVKPHGKGSSGLARIHVQCRSATILYTHRVTEL